MHYVYGPSQRHLRSEQVRTILLAFSHHHDYRVTIFVIIVIISVIITAITIVIIFTTIPARSLHDKITVIAYQVIIVLSYVIISGWWYTYPSEKYESQLGLLFPIYGNIMK